MNDPKQRFSQRAEDYARHRPGYPHEVLELLERECGFTRHSTVADIASGTGLLSELFLGNGNRVYGVEPNDEMREAGKRHLARYERFVSVGGSAEDTTLADASVDFVVVGHAFHWFDGEPTRAEFARILRRDRWVALLWNEMRVDATPFMAGYEALIRAHKTEEYKPFDREAEVRRFFEPEGFKLHAFRHQQTFDFEGLRGRLLSSSYVPASGEPGHGEMIERLEGLFQRHSMDGLVSMEYETLVYLGRLGG